MKILGIGSRIQHSKSWRRCCDQRFHRGKLILDLEQAGIVGKEVPIDTFFHKIVMVRDRIRVMEQKINASKLEESEKIEMQQYIMRIYGNLTRFNMLFKSNFDYFLGKKTK